MSLRAYLWGIRLFLLFSLGAFMAVVIMVDPEQTGSVGKGLFLGTFFGVMLASLVLCVTWIYKRVLGVVGVTHHLGRAFRQAFLLALFGAVLVMLHMEQLLTWWGGLLLLVAVFLLEFTARRFGGDVELMI